MIVLSKIVVISEIGSFHYEFLIHSLYVWAKPGYAIFNIYRQNASLSVNAKVQERKILSPA